MILAKIFKGSLKITVLIRCHDLLSGSPQGTFYVKKLQLQKALPAHMLQGQETLKYESAGRNNALSSFLYKH